MANKQCKDTKWIQRGFQSKAEYLGWLYFNDLTDESNTFDEVYLGPFTGRTIRVAGEEAGDTVEDEADEFLATQDN